MIVLVLFLAALLPAQAADAWYSSRLLRIADQETVSLAELTTEISSSGMVFFGELHSQVDHHDLELRLARVLEDTATSLVIGVEMIQASDQGALSAWVAGEMDEKEFAEVFESNWRSTWQLYRPLFEFARRNQIPMLALNVPDEITRQVAKEGFYSLSREQMAQLPGVSCQVSPQYMATIKKAISMHGPGSGGISFERFCEAQMVWDSTMAWRLASYHWRNPASTILVIAGNTHAWKHGIPEQLLRRNAYATRILLPEVPGRIDRATTSADETDYLLEGVDLGPLH